jgi:hypothetical protein
MAPRGVAPAWREGRPAAAAPLLLRAIPVPPFSNPSLSPPRRTYGLVDVECTKCLDHSSTAAPGATNQSMCLVDPGYGWADGQVLECE